MACLDYRFVRFPCQSIRHDSAIQNVQKSLLYPLLYGKSMRLSSLNRGFQTVCLSFHESNPATFHSASAAILNQDDFFSPTPFSRSLIALHAVNAASTTEESDIEPSAMSRIVRISHESRTDGSQYPHHSPPSCLRRNLAVFTLNYLLAFSSLPCSPAHSAISLLPEHLLGGHHSTPLCSLSSSVQKSTPSIIPPPTTLAVLDLPRNNPSVSWNQNGKSGEVEAVSEEGNCATCLGDVDGTLGACSAAANCVSTFDDR